MLTELHDGRFLVPGRFRDFIVSADGSTCQCGRVGGCTHREALALYLAGNERSCPCCAGNGLRTLSRADKHAIVGGAEVSAYVCEGCGGMGCVTPRRRAALEAGLRRQKGTRAA